MCQRRPAKWTRGPVGKARQEHGRQRHAFEVTEIVKIVSVEDRTL